MDLLIKESDVNMNFTNDEMRDEVSSMMAGVGKNYVGLLN